MAVELTPQQVEDYYMSKSVMDEPRGGFQRVSDFLFGRTLPEQMTAAATTPLGSAQIAKIAPQVADPAAIARALRGMGRETLNYLRKRGVTLNVLQNPRLRKSAGRYLRGEKTHVVELAPNVSEDVPFHEITAHFGMGTLPKNLSGGVSAAQRTIANEPAAQTLAKAIKRLGYWKKDVPEELFAFSREPGGGPGFLPDMPPETKLSLDYVARDTRKELGKILQRLASGETPTTGDWGVAALELAKKQGRRGRQRIEGEVVEEPNRLLQLLREMGPRVDPNAEVFERNAELLKPLLGGD